MTGRTPRTRREAAALLRAMGAPADVVAPYERVRDYVYTMPCGDRVRCHKGAQAWTLTWERGEQRAYPRMTSMDAVRTWLRQAYGLTAGGR